MMTIGALSNEDSDRLGWRSFLLVMLVCALLYAPGVFGGRPLSIHEARLPELAREMVSGTSDWLLPQSAGRPWLERPPLPHWFTAAAMIVFRRTDAVWVVRLPAALVGAYVCVIAAWMTTRWFGRSTGVLAGLVLASSYELYQYATLAEDDIYLAGIVITCVALFVRTEWPRQGPAIVRQESPFGRRAFTIALFFATLGLTNLAKGPMVGALPILAAVAIFLLGTRDAARLRRYVWLWGWLLFAGLAMAWPAWALHRYPDVLNNWRFDYLGHAQGVPADAAKEWDEPRWYYLMMLPLALVPWTWATVIGFVQTARTAWQRRDSAERFCWIWTCGGIVVLSLPARKHHHYLVPLMAPFAILTALGLRAVGRAIARRNDREDPDAAVPGSSAGAGLLVFAFGALIVISGYVQIRVAGQDDATLALAALCRQATERVPADQPIFVNADTDSLEFFRIQFALGPRGRLLHNLTFLRDRDLAALPVDYLITRARDRGALEQLGEVEQLDQASMARRERSPGERFTLFRLTPASDLARGPKPSAIGVLEAMGRKPGPWIAPPVKP